MNPANQQNTTLSRSFLTWLSIIVLVGFTVTVGVSWLLQTRLSNDNAKELLQINITDVQQSILDASDKNLVELTTEVKEALPEGQDATNERLMELMKQFDVPEIAVIDDQGFICASTHPGYIGFDMSEGEQSQEFMCLIDGDETSFVQELRPISYDSNILRKFAGVRFEDGGFVQVGYDPERFQEDLAELVKDKAHNRHVGKEGFLMIADRNWKLVSDPFFNEGQPLSISGLQIDAQNTPENQVFQANVYGDPCSCLFVTSEGYYIVAVIPENEIVLQRDTSVALSTSLEIIIFIALFVMIFMLVRGKVVKNINRVNKSLSKITEGNLDEVVDVRSNVEFSSLSDDINATVSTLKQYIASAAARIDEELAFAKGIQQSALPSVFPPYPDRTDFSLYATMDTAKEVGGDFYDFYLVDDNRLAFLVADVSGKGIPAALFMMTGKTVIRDHAERGDEPVEVFQNANDTLCDGNDAEMFITAWMGFLDTDTGLVRFVNAGHNPPVLIRNGQASYIEQRANVILAAMEGLPYCEQNLQLQPDDLLFLYTDGIPEATNAQEDMYGADRLLEILSANYGTGEAACRGICATVKEDIDTFVADAPQFDDITMLCLYYRGEERDGNA